MLPTVLVRIFAVFCVFATSMIVVAAEPSAYQAAQPVSDRASATQQRAMLAAFKEVLVRASGTQRALEAFYVQESFKKVASFVRTFEYREVELKVDGATQDQLMLFVTFDRTAVRRLLQDAAVPMWGGRIPVSLIWLAYEDNFERKVVNSANPESSELGELLKQQLERRGLPMVLPLMDLEDTMIVSPSDIWGRFSGPIEEASERYGSEAVLSGRLVQSGSRWEAKVMLSINGQQRLEDFTGESPEGVVGSFVDWLGESLCDVYCVSETYSANNQWQLIIKDVGSFYSYRSLLNYLEKLPAIRKVEMASVKARNAMVTVDLVGDVDALKQAINLDRKLVMIDNPAEVASIIEFMAPEVPQSEQQELPPISPDNSGSAGQSVVPEIASEGAPVDSAVPMSQAPSIDSGVPQETRPQNILVYRWRP